MGWYLNKEQYSGEGTKTNEKAWDMVKYCSKMLNVLFILIPNDETVNVRGVWNLRRNPCDLKTVWSDFTKIQINGGWYSY